MDDLEHATLTFEAVKTSMNQNKDGMILRIAIHPNDVPRQLMTDWVGTRYQVVMVRLGDDDQPEASDETMAASRAVKSAGLLARNEVFHDFLSDRGDLDLSDPGTAVQNAAQAMRLLLGVNSRAEMKENPEALKRFYQLRDEFLEWRQQNATSLKTERRHDKE